MSGHDETCDERIRCGRHGRRDAGASPGQDPGVVRSWSGGDYDVSDAIGDADDRECDDRECERRRRAGQANHVDVDNVALAGAEGFPEDGQSRGER